MENLQCKTAFCSLSTFEKKGYGFKHFQFQSRLMYHILPIENSLTTAFFNNIFCLFPVSKK